MAGRLLIVTFDDEKKPSKPAPFVPIDSKEMADRILERLEDHRVTLIQGHGAFARARTIQQGLYRVCVANNSGYVVRLLERMGADVAAVRERILRDPDESFTYPPPPYTIEDDDRNDFPEERELVHEFRKTGWRLFESKITPFHTGSLSVRGIRSMLYAPKASAPRDLTGPLLELPLAPDADDSREVEMHKAIYASGNFQTVAHCYVPEAEAYANCPVRETGELPTKLVPIDAEGSFLYLVVPVVPPDVDLDRLCHLLHEYKVVIVRGGGVWGVGMQSLSEVLHHPSSVRETVLYRVGAAERGLDLSKLEPEQAKSW